MGENLGDHRGVFDGGDERQGAATVRTGCHVDFKHPFEQLGPAQAGRRGCGGCSAVLIGGGRCLVGLAWDDLGSEGSVGREHAMEANEMERGRGTSAARRCMNSSGAITR
jgi:hypothetical protein